MDRLSLQRTIGSLIIVFLTCRALLAAFGI